MNWLYIHKPDDSGWLVDPYGNKYPAVSGPYRNGALPEGLYDLVGKIILPGGEPTTDPYADSRGFAWWVPLKPCFNTGRSGLGIHPDGNLPGTLGCIGVQIEDTRALFEQLPEKGILRVIYV